MPKTTKDSPQASTQSSLLISEIKDGIVVLKDGSLRAVIMASAINFDLMSQQEQSGAEYAYQGFINSLHFPIQIVVKSQKIDLDGYIEDLEKRHAAQDNQLLAMLMEDYIANVKALVEEVNIMDKQFYVVIPFFPSVISKAGFFASVSNLFKSSPSITVSESEFTQYKTELTNRVQLVSSGLSQMGIRAIPLSTQELVELYYAAYNPDVAPNQKLINYGDLGTASVTRGQKAAAAAGPIPGSQPSSESLIPEPAMTTQTPAVAVAQPSPTPYTPTPEVAAPPAPTPVAAPEPAQPVATSYPQAPSAAPTAVPMPEPVPPSQPATTPAPPPQPEVTQPDPGTFAAIPEVPPAPARTFQPTAPAAPYPAPPPAAAPAPAPVAGQTYQPAPAQTPPSPQAPPSPIPPNPLEGK